MKKFIIIVIMIVTTISSYINVNAAVSGSISGGGTISTGGTVQVSIGITSDIKLAAIQASIEYDTSKLSLISSSGDSRYNFSAGTNSFLLDSSCSGDACPTGSFNIVTLTFQATSSFLPGETSSINLISVSGSDGVVSQSGGSGSVTVSISRVLSSNNDLSSLSVDGTNILTTSSYSTNNSSVNITALASDTSATISGTGTKNLDYGNNSFTISVTAENGSKRNYPITITRNDTRSSNTNLSSLTVEGTSVLDTLAFSTDSASVTINATTADTKSIVTGIGTKTLSYGINSFDINVKAENGTTKSYSLKITRNDNRSQDNTLSVLTVDGKNVLDSLNLTTDSTTVVIVATAKDSKATVTGAGSKNLDFGLNQFSIIVTAENQSKKTYTLNVTRNDNRSSDNNLKVLKVDGVNVSGFSSSKTTYELGETSSSTINITAEKSNEKATITGVGVKTLAYGANTFEVKVTAENNSVKTYYLKISKIDNRSTNSKLKSLSIDVADLNFQASEQFYYLTVENSVKVVSITATPEVSSSKISGTGLKELVNYENTFSIVVTAENQTKTTYNIKIMRKDEKGFLGNVSNNNFLDSLIIKDFVISFNKETLNYEVNVPLTVESLTVEAVTEDEKATLTIEYPEKLIFGRNIINIRVVSESFEQRIYTITAIRGSDVEFIGQDDMDKYFNELLAEDLILTLRGDEVIKTSLLNKIFDSGKSLSIRVVDEITSKVILWSVPSEVIKDLDKHNFGISYSLTSDDRLEKILNFSPKMLLDFETTGKFPKGVEVEVDVSSDFVDSDIINVYLFDANTGKLIKIIEELVVLDGKVKFSPLSGGKYIFTKAKFETFPISLKTLFAVTVIQSISLIQIAVIMLVRFLKKRRV